MWIVIPTQKSRIEEERRGECDGFYAGAHGTSLDVALTEIDAEFEEKKAKLQAETIVIQKKLEADIEYLGTLAPEVQRAWAAVQERVGDRLPNIVLPSVIVLLGVVALIAEALLLAPAMDVLNVTEPATQLFTALGIAAVAGMSFHFAWESFTAQRFPRVWKIACRIVAVGLALGLVAWGILRGLQVGFAAHLSQNPLGDFLAGHPILASIFYVFITLATPLMAATASHFGANALQLWWEWKSLQRQSRSVAYMRAQATKGLEREAKALVMGLKALEEKCNWWKAAYTLHHKRGTSFGAKQEPYWTVPAKATFAALLALFLAGWFIWFVSPFFFLFPIIVWWAAFWHCRRQWRSPSPKEFFELEYVQFVSPAHDRAQSELPARAFRG